MEDFRPRPLLNDFLIGAGVTGRLGPKHPSVLIRVVSITLIEASNGCVWKVMCDSSSCTTDPTRVDTGPLLFYIRNLLIYVLNLLVRYTRSVYE